MSRYQDMGWVFYREMGQEETTIGKVLALYEAFDRATEQEEKAKAYAQAVSIMAETAEEYGLSGNLWHALLALEVARAENAFTRAAEKRGKPQGTLPLLALHDLAKFRTLFLDCSRLMDLMSGCHFAPLIAAYEPAGKDGGGLPNEVRERIMQLAAELAAARTDEAFLEAACRFYADYGAGLFGLHKAFCLSGEGEKAHLSPIAFTEPIRLSDLIGYERQKARLVENTEAFLAGRPANNCLLYGDAGTGKSSSIKALLNEYYAGGLRLIELYKHQVRDLPRIIASLRGRNYRFIIYMDDLSFEDYEIEYKYLKAVIEGGMAARPDNVLIYATSNRRHLVKERTGDAADYDTELHSSDTKQEKLSLAARFGLTVYYGAPGKNEYEEIVLGLAKAAGLALPEKELLMLANQWELTHGGRSGRCARQLVTYLRGREEH